MDGKPHSTPLNPLEKQEIKLIKKKKVRWAPFFSLAIMLACAVNVINSVVLLWAVRSTGEGTLTGEALRAFSLNIFLSVVMVILGLGVFIARMPASVRVWEYKEWGKKIGFWLLTLSALAVMLYFVIVKALALPEAQRKIFFLLEGIVVNALVIWYFSKSKIKSVFVK